MPEEIRTALTTARERHLVVVHDREASRIPWETIHASGWIPATGGGLSRRYLAENLSVAKWLEERQFGRELDILLVVNPTGDLDGAEKEGDRLREIFGGHSAVRIDELRRGEATRPAIGAAIRSGRYDVLHYAGHAAFDENDPSRSGILCHGRERLPGHDLVGLANLPALVFFNACEAARVRRGEDREREELSIRSRIERSVGLAEAFLRGGVANYIGTYWPVGDSPAESFAESFYTRLVQDDSIDAAILAGRKKLHEMETVDWADIHYGARGFVLKFGA